MKKLRTIKIRTILKQIILLIMLAVFISTPVAEARGYEDLSVDQLARMGIYFTKGDFTCGNNATAVSGGGSAGGNASLKLTAQQVTNAKTIIGVVKTYNLGKKGAQIALIVALAESHLRTYASDVVPVSKENPVWLKIPKDDRFSGHDFDSVGVYQQRVGSGWSTYGSYGQSGVNNKAVVWQLMDTTYSIQAFLGTPPGADLPANLKNPGALRKGLLNKSGWQDLQPWEAAQKVQVSAYDGNPRRANNYSSVYGGNYKDQMEKADKIIATYWESSPAVPVIIKTGEGGVANNADATGNDICPEDAAAGTGTNGALMQTIVKYAWPTYHQANYITKKPEYAAAIKAAQKRGEYVGGGKYPGVDCGGFVTRVYRDSGVDPKYNGYQSNVVSQRRWLNNHPEQYQKLNGLKQSELKPGDIWINSDASHTFMYVGKVANFHGNSASASFSTSDTSWRSPMASNMYGLSGATIYRNKAMNAAPTVATTTGTTAPTN